MILRVVNLNHLRIYMSSFSKFGQRNIATIIIKRFYVKEHRSGTPKQEKATAVTDKVGPERSYLEEILLEREQEPKTTGQKGMLEIWSNQLFLLVKRAAETSFYIGFGIVSLTVFSGLTYLLFTELFSFNSPNGVYRDALKRVKSDERCQEIFGTKILAHGEESGRGRRRHIANNRFIKDGQERLRVMFHVKVFIITLHF